MWHAQAHQWGCDHCRDLVGGPPPFPAPVAPPGSYVTQPVPKCPRCAADATWQAQAGTWGCDRCKIHLDPAVVAAGSTAAVGDAGAKVAKVLLWLVLIIGLIAIKVALRSHR